MKPVSAPIAIRGWLSRMRRSMVEPERIEPTMKIGASSMRAIMAADGRPRASLARSLPGGAIRQGR